MQPLNVYIGFDSKFGVDAAKVCVASLVECSSIPIAVTLLDQKWLRRIGLYRRQSYEVDGQSYDTIDNRPFSTEFSFSRFLVPSLQPSGWAVFVDSDFLFRSDIAAMQGLFDDRYAVMVVKHDYQPGETQKMLGQAQQTYFRKNWSSLVAWNCSHHSARMLTPYMVNIREGAWLHGFGWMRDEEIGALPEAWNWLDGHSPDDVDAAAAHFTRGTPDMPGWESTRYADEWRATLEKINGSQ